MCTPVDDYIRDHWHGANQFENGPKTPNYEHCGRHTGLEVQARLRELLLRDGRSSDFTVVQGKSIDS